MKESGGIGEEEKGDKDRIQGTYCKRHANLTDFEIRPNILCSCSSTIIFTQVCYIEGCDKCTGGRCVAIEK
jgi:hypothetical protein